MIPTIDALSLGTNLYGRTIVAVNAILLSEDGIRRTARDYKSRTRKRIRSRGRLLGTESIGLAGLATQIDWTAGRWNWPVARQLRKGCVRPLSVNQAHARMDTQQSLPHAEAAIRLLPATVSHVSVAVRNDHLDRVDRQERQPRPACRGCRRPAADEQAVAGLDPVAAALYSTGADTGPHTCDHSVPGGHQAKTCYCNLLAHHPPLAGSVYQPGFRPFRVRMRSSIRLRRILLARAFPFPSRPREGRRSRFSDSRDTVAFHGWRSSRLPGNRHARLFHWTWALPRHARPIRGRHGAGRHRHTAHITARPNEGAAGTYFETSRKVPHGQAPGPSPSIPGASRLDRLCESHGFPVTRQISMASPLAETVSCHWSVSCKPVEVKRPHKAPVDAKSNRAAEPDADGGTFALH